MALEDKAVLGVGRRSLLTGAVLAGAASVLPGAMSIVPVAEAAETPGAIRRGLAL